MAGVAKWLRQWVVVPPFVGSSPIIRPKLKLRFIKENRVIFDISICHVIEDQDYALKGV